MTKYNKLKASLAIHDKQLNDFCDEIKVSRSNVTRYFKGKFERHNYYLEEKLESLWKSAVDKINKYEQQQRFNQY